MTVRIAVVGAGPAGFYTCEALLKRNAVGGGFQVDLIERLPMPYGLVRYGVAPDHQKIKSVTRAFDKIAQNPAFRFFGNVELGKDVTAAELLERYDAVVLAIGCGTDRKLGIPGEDLRGVYPATKFVAWYNGHPDFRDYGVKLDHHHAVVVGAGDVSLDITRMLLRKPEDLAGTDITDYAFKAFSENPVRRVTIVIRRGPGQAPFAVKELRDIEELGNVVIKIDAKAVAAALEEQATQDDGLLKRKLEYLAELATRSHSPQQGEDTRTIEFLFQHSPLEAGASDGRLSTVTVEKTKLVPDARGTLRAQSTGERVVLEAGLLFPAIGYRGVAVPGVPFDDNAGIIPNQAGRVVQPTGEVIQGLYTAGWIKRGPSGVIGTNKSDASDTVELLVQDLAGGNRVSGEPQSLERLLASRNVRVVTLRDWARLDQVEQERGKSAGKLREKLTSAADALSLLE